MPSKDRPSGAVIFFLLSFIALSIPALAWLEADTLGRYGSIASLAAGAGAVVLLTALGLLRLWRNRGVTPEGQVSVLTATGITSVITGLGAAIVALAGDLGGNVVFVIIAPIACWWLTVFLWPFWTDAGFIRTSEPEEGWVRVLGIRLAYRNPSDPALWVRLASTLDYRSMGYTPNLGHPWGWFVFQAFGVLLLYLFAALFAAVTA